MTRSESAPRHYTLGLVFASFVAIGIVNGLLGVAWPTMRATFGLPLDALASLLVSTTMGFVAGSLMAAGLINRFGIAWVLILMNILSAFGLFGYAVSPGWLLIVLLGLLTGFASGAIDTGLNIYIAATRTVRIMNWMHAMFGVGATLGPLIMTAVIGSGKSWRLGYFTAGLVHLFLGLLFITVLNTLMFRGMGRTLSVIDGKASKPPTSRATLRLPIVLLGVLLFLFYTGVESTTGQWSYTLFTESRSVTTYIAGIMTSVFWAMLTAGRIIFGAMADRIGIKRLLRWSMIGAVVSASLFLIPNQVVGFVAVALMGLSLSAIFPTLTSDTPFRVGLQHAANAIGFQTGAASVGFALLPGLAGVLAARMGLEILGPYLVIASILMFITNEIAMWLVGRNRLRGKTTSYPASTTD